MARNRERVPGEAGQFHTLQPRNRLPVHVEGYSALEIEAGDLLGQRSRAGRLVYTSTISEDCKRVAGEWTDDGADGHAYYPPPG